MIKEKLIFWPLLGVFICTVAFGFFSRGNEKEAADELLQEIELATKKSIAKKKLVRDKWDIKNVKALDTIDGYKAILKRSPFFRVVSEKKVKKLEIITVEKKPKKPLFKYKGRVMMGSKIMVIIEDRGTGKSFFLQEGDMVGDFKVVVIGEKEVMLRQKGGKEIVLKSVKKEKKSADDVKKKADKPK